MAAFLSPIIRSEKQYRYSTGGKMKITFDWLTKN